MRVWMIGAEMAPFSKVGGLGDVLGALPSALAARGLDVTVVIPHLGSMNDARLGIADTGVEVTPDPPPGAEPLTARVLEARVAGGVRVLFVHCPPYFHREGVYGTAHGDYPDNAQRFAFFCRAAILAAEKIAPAPDVVHAHDWQAGLVPYLLRAPDQFGGVPGLSRPFLLQSIHNLSYQGVFPKEFVPRIGIPWPDFVYTRLEFYDQLNFLKGGIVFADAVATVSPTYAGEIQTPEHGWGLDGVLRERADRLHGILNGIDTDLWNPAKDKKIAAKFGPGKMSNRPLNAKALKKKMKLASDGRPVVGMVSRLVTQKGVDILLALGEGVAELGFQWAIVGTGEHRHEEAVRAFAARFPGTVAAHIGFDDGLGRLVYAGSDFFFMPSLFEPCGLGQMIALRYGSLPVVRRTGGLADTVPDMREPGGVGFAFDRADAEAALGALCRARELRADWRRFAAVRRRAMAMDFSWDASAERYEELYRSGVAARKG